MTKTNGPEIVSITPLDGAVTLLAAKCKSLISAFARILDEDAQEIQDAVSKALAVEAPSSFAEALLTTSIDRALSAPQQPRLSAKTSTPLHLSQTKINQIRRYKRDHTVKQVAERFNLTQSQATYAIYANPKKKNSKARTVRYAGPGGGLTDAQQQELKSRLIAGQSVPEIMQYMGISHQTVYKYKAQFTEASSLEQNKAAESQHA